MKFSDIPVLVSTKVNPNLIHLYQGNQRVATIDLTKPPPVPVVSGVD